MATAMGLRDLLYTPSRFVPDMDWYVSEYARRSEDARAMLPWVEHAYGPDPAERLLFFPAAGSAAPLQVFVHGGYWQESSKEDSCFAAPDFVSRGAAFAALGYGLAPAYRLDEIVAMVRRGLLWIHRNARALGVDPGRVFLSGSSAGAHLVAMFLEDGRPGPGTRIRDVVRGATLLSGLYDLEPLRRTYIGAAIGLTPAESARNSPIGRPHRELPPLVVARGGAETEAFADQQERYVRSLERTGTAVTDLVVGGRDHFDLALGLGDPSGPLGRATLDLMRLP
ncbi:alpha/beta hydrolase [Actinomadura sp. 7K534]|uniref:alpha/beta hydrolase n=1 Tax=Actinomadura sp. 7K534 TaxID=2530366 RepID=UPI0010474C7B|nr:alpha/beta hydrolase [Actinomadura sp. 7K534]TDB98874.1 alpha/beta hydrolase [Actinomadura sp. 7K534]